RWRTCSLKWAVILVLGRCGGGGGTVDGAEEACNLPVEDRRLETSYYTTGVLQSSSKQKNWTFPINYRRPVTSQVAGVEPPIKRQEACDTPLNNRNPITSHRATEG
ncbi:hypothetical protein OTU49_000144, partial [Cherax quadricarinatus]